MIPTELLQAFVETHYLVRHQPPFTLHIGQKSAALDKLLNDSGQACAAFITAWNPMAQALSVEENRMRQTRLEEELSSRGLKFIRGIGQHPSNGWPAEDSVLVLGIQAEFAHSLCRQFGQLACVFYQGCGVAEIMSVDRNQVPPATQSH